MGFHAPGTVVALAAMATTPAAVARRGARPLANTVAAANTPRTRISSANPAEKKKKRGHRLCCIAMIAAAVTAAGSSMTAVVTGAERA